MSKYQVELKRPILIKILALMFILAPVGNVLISFYIYSMNKSSANLIEMLRYVPVYDWIWLFLIFASGILLLIQHKTAWLMSVTTLVFTLSMNLASIYRASPYDDQNAYFYKIQILISVLITISMLVILSYLRFPYIDRRQGWFLAAVNRMKVKTAVTVMAQDIFQGVTESLSVRGCRIMLNQDMGSIAKMKFVDIVLPEVRNIKLKGRVVSYHDNVLRLRFKDLRQADKQILTEWLNNQA